MFDNGSKDGERASQDGSTSHDATTAAFDLLVTGLATGRSI